MRGDNDENNGSGKKGYSVYHLLVFVVTFLSYALLHTARKTFSNVKTTISEEWTPSQGNSTDTAVQPDTIWSARSMFPSTYEAEPFLGVLDASFMISYAVGLFISGMLGDRMDPRYVLSVGMCGAAITVFLFGCVLEWAHFYNIYLYLFLWICNGLLQSTGWPTTVALMGNWFGKSSRGFVFGIWSANASVGNILGSLMVASVLDYGYEYAFLFTSSVLFAGGVIVFFGVVSSPAELGKDAGDETGTRTTDKTSERGDHRGEESGGQPDIEREEEEEEEEGGGRPGGINLIKAILLPGVILYSLAYAFLKLVNYSFFFWLPYYLANAYHWKETVADSISIWYDVGGIIGGMVGGFVSDRFEKRALILVPMSLLAIPALFGYSNSPANLTINSILMSVAGFFIGGVANLISGAVAADLGRQKNLNEVALATVAGIIDGTGSTGAAIGQILVPYLQQALGWGAVFYFFMISVFLTGVCMLPVFTRDVKDLLHARACCRHTTGAREEVPDDKEEQITRF